VYAALRRGCTHAGGALRMTHASSYGSWGGCSTRPCLQTGEVICVGDLCRPCFRRPLSSHLSMYKLGKYFNNN
jgi:hypothetical protein